ncbi:unnamed protein product [Periconia digitata]|uniref:Secreted protein n=1 Tax=Periconia digitata TaxID=1303443 RepID=A0A9W4UIC5_9PLEO|nr:unnamed protein product [Periconia digitata]
MTNRIYLISQVQLLLVHVLFLAQFEAKAGSPRVVVEHCLVSNSFQLLRRLSTNKVASPMDRVSAERSSPGKTEAKRGVLPPVLCIAASCSLAQVSFFDVE